MEIRSERQLSPVADDFSALIAVTRPIVVGLLHSIGEEYLAPHGGRADMRLADLGRVRKASDGDLGVAFEYAVHDAMLRAEAVVSERVATALVKVRIATSEPASILFALEKNGGKQLVQTKRELITPDSRVLSGKRGQPIKLHGYVNQLSAAFSRPSTRLSLPDSIKGLWKADLFLGDTERDHWVGTTVKINARSLEAAAGLRIAIVPHTTGSDAIRLDESKNLVLCPIPHDFSFMQTFHEGMQIVQTLVAHDFNAPTPAQLPNPVHREIAKAYVDRRKFSISEVLDALAPFAQPHLLETSPDAVTTSVLGDMALDTDVVLGPIAMTTEG